MGGTQTSPVTCRTSPAGCTGAVTRHRHGRPRASELCSVLTHTALGFFGLIFAPTLAIIKFHMKTQVSGFALRTAAAAAPAPPLGRRGRSTEQAVPRPPGGRPPASRCTVPPRPIRSRRRD